MVQDGIRDGDIVVVRRQRTAENGQTVVALVYGEATVKRLYRVGNRRETPSGQSATEVYLPGGWERGVRDPRLRHRADTKLPALRLARYESLRTTTVYTHPSDKNLRVGVCDLMC
jgi:hypothetical protein